MMLATPAAEMRIVLAESGPAKCSPRSGTVAVSREGHRRCGGRCGLACRWHRQVIGTAEPQDDRYSFMTAQRYQMIRELGANPAGGRVTYLARDRHTEQKVVIKRYHNRTDAAFATYQRELAMLRQLNHPQIPRYLDAFPVPQGVCLVQAYKAAPSLAVPRAWSSAEVQQIADSLLAILCDLQAATPPLIHRDLKPANILAERQATGWIAYLVDFGCAQPLDARDRAAAGTFGFMGLEQLYHRPLSTATDLYGLGMTLLCLLTGLPARRAGELVDEAQQPCWRDRFPNLAPAWLDWLERLVQPRARDRYPSALAARTALHELQRAPRPARSRPADPPAVDLSRALARHGRPCWTEADFQNLLKTLGEAGYGWLSPEVVRQQLAAMQQHRQQD